MFPAGLQSLEDLADVFGLVSFGPLQVFGRAPTDLDDCDGCSISPGRSCGPGIRQSGKALG